MRPKSRCRAVWRKSLLGLFLALALAAGACGGGSDTSPDATVVDSEDIDIDGDGLIEIRNLEMLDHVRNNLRGTSYHNGRVSVTTGCGGASGVSACTGYELVGDLDFAEGASYASGRVNQAWRPTGGTPETSTNAGWAPIGDNSTFRDTSHFTGTFEGNGFAVKHLYVRLESSSGSEDAGLFGIVGAGGALQNLGVEEAYISSFSSSPSSPSSPSAGGVAGVVLGEVTNSYGTGSVSSSSSSPNSFSSAGGVAGVVDNGGEVTNSYGTGSVSSSSSSSSSVAAAGGVAGVVEFGGEVTNSYGTGSVSSSSSSFESYAGGVAGSVLGGGKVRNSYGTGSVSSSSSSESYAGGVAGYVEGEVTNSYWDTEKAELRESEDGGGTFTSRSGDVGQGEAHSGITGLTSSEMQAVSGTHPSLLGAELDLGAASEYPRVLYGGTEGTDCESITTNDKLVNEGDTEFPDCGDLLPGQAVRQALGLLRFSNTEIGHPVFAGNPVVADNLEFFYQVGSGSTLEIRGIGANGTTASFTVGGATGAAISGLTVSTVMETTTISGLSDLSAGTEFYLMATLTKGSESVTGRHRFKK